MTLGKAGAYSVSASNALKKPCAAKSALLQLLPPRRGKVGMGVNCYETVSDGRLALERGASAPWRSQPAQVEPGCTNGAKLLPGIVFTSDSSFTGFDRDWLARHGTRAALLDARVATNADGRTDACRVDAIRQRSFTD